MGIVLEQPLYLLALPVILVVAWMGYRNRSQYLTLWKSICLVAAGACVSIAAAAPILTLSGSTEHHIWLVDVSDSSNINNEQLNTLFASKKKVLDDTDRISVLLFGDDNEWLVRRGKSSSPVSLNQISEVRNRIDGSASNPADALNTALATRKTGEQLVPVLISDGQFGDQQRERLHSIVNRTEISLHTQLSRSRTLPDVWIEQVRSPSYIKTEQPFELQVRIRATGSYDGQIRVSRPDGQQSSTSIPFSIRNDQTRTFRTKITAGKEAFQRYKVTLSTDNDEWSQRNNSFTTGVRAAQKFNVLWIGSRNLFDRFAPALETANRSLQHAAQPTRTAPYDLFLLTGPASDVTEEWQNKVARSVRRRGSGLIMLGTNRTFARGGWADTEVESLLPTRMFPPDLLSINVLLDVSGSMSNSPGSNGNDRSKLDVVKEAMFGALQLLQPSDRLGLRSFSNAPRLLRPLEKLGRPGDLSDRLQSLSAGGETRLLPALRDAIESLSEAPPENRYLLIFTDGQLTGNQNAFTEVSETAADRQIKFIILTTGDRADQKRLRLLTDGGNNGRVLSLDTIRSLESKLQNQLKRIRSFIRTGTAETSFSSTASPSILPGEREGLPQKTGPYHRVTEKRFSTTPIRSKPHNEPLLSAWQPGRGRSLTLTPIFERPGALPKSSQTAWVRLLRHTVDWALPARPSNWTLQTEISSKQLTVFAQRTTPPQNLQSLRATGSLEGETGDKRAMKATPLSPDQVRFQTERPASGSYQFSAVIQADGEDITLTTPVNIPVEREYLHPQPDGSFLNTLAKRAGGQFLGSTQEEESLNTNPDDTSQRRLPMERYAMMIAGLFLLLVLIKR